MQLLHPTNESIYFVFTPPTDIHKTSKYKRNTTVNGESSVSEVTVYSPENRGSISGGCKHVPYLNLRIDRVRSRCGCFERAESSHVLRIRNDLSRCHHSGAGHCWICVCGSWFQILFHHSKTPNRTHVTSPAARVTVVCVSVERCGRVEVWSQSFLNSSRD